MEHVSVPQDLETQYQPSRWVVRLGAEEALRTYSQMGNEGIWDLSVTSLSGLQHVAVVSECRGEGRSAQSQFKAITIAQALHTVGSGPGARESSLQNWRAGGPQSTMPPSLPALPSMSLRPHATAVQGGAVKKESLPRGVLLLFIQSSEDFFS